MKKISKELMEEIKNIFIEREKARARKDWKWADELRQKINKLGFSVEDTKEKVTLRLDPKLLRETKN